MADNDNDDNVNVKDISLIDTTDNSEKPLSNTDSNSEKPLSNTDSNSEKPLSNTDSNSETTKTDSAATDSNKEPPSNTNNNVYEKLKNAGLLITDEHYARAKPFITGKKYRLIFEYIMHGFGNIETIFENDIKTTWLYRIALYNKLVEEKKISGTPIVFEKPNIKATDSKATDSKATDSNVSDSEPLTDYKEEYIKTIQPIFDTMKTDEEEYNKNRAIQTQNKNTNIAKFNKEKYYNKITLKISDIFLRGIGYVSKNLNITEEKKLLDIVNKVKNAGISEPQDISQAMLILITNAANKSNAFFEKLQKEDKTEDESNNNDTKPTKSIFDWVFGPTKIVIAKPIDIVLPNLPVNQPSTLPQLLPPPPPIKKQGGSKKTRKNIRKKTRVKRKTNSKNQKKSRRKV